MVDSYGRNRRCATGHLPVSRHDEIRTTFLAPGIESDDKSLTPRQQKPCVSTARRGATRQDEIASLMSHATRSHVSLVANGLVGSLRNAVKATETECRVGLHSVGSRIKSSRILHLGTRGTIDSGLVCRVVRPRPGESERRFRRES